MGVAWRVGGEGELGWEVPRVWDMRFDAWGGGEEGGAVLGLCSGRFMFCLSVYGSVRFGGIGCVWLTAYLPAYLVVGVKGAGGLAGWC